MMDELNALNAPKKVVDGLVEVFDGLAQMFAGVSEQLDMLAANAKTEDELELPVAEQPVLPVTEKKGPAVSHPRKKPVKKTKKVEETAPSAIEEAAEVPVVEDSGEAEEAVNSESSLFLHSPSSRFTETAAASCMWGKRRSPSTASKTMCCSTVRRTTLTTLPASAMRPSFRMISRNCRKERHRSHGQAVSRRWKSFPVGGRSEGRCSR